MKLDRVQINVQAVTIEVSGEPYAYMGGFIDLKPYRARTMVVGWDVSILAFDTVDGRTGDRSFNEGTVHAMNVGIDGLAHREFSLWTQTYDPASPTVENLLELAGHYETERRVPEGFVDALRAWFEAQGVEIGD
jgi:hypothetical protein